MTNTSVQQEVLVRSARGAPAPVQRFRLLRYFTLVSLLIVLVVALASSVTSGILVYWAFLQDETDLADNLATDVLARLELHGFSREKWGHEDLSEKVRAAIRVKLDNFDVIDFGLFQTDGRPLLLIGSTPGTSANTMQFNQAAKGKMAVNWEGRSWEPYWPGASSSSIVDSYIPIRDDKGVFAVVHVRRDATQSMTAARRIAPMITVIEVAGAMLVFAALWLLILRADRIIRSQHGQLEDARRELEENIHCLEQLSASKDHFLSICSHDLRSPLVSIVAGCRVLSKARREMTDPGAKEIIDSILKRANDSLALIDSLLDLARIEAGREELNLENVSLSDLLLDVRQGHESLASQHGTSIVLNVPPEPIHLRADRIKLQRVCNNLLSNAIKHAHQSPVRLELGAQDDGVVISVSNHGPGISREDQSRLFDRLSTLAMRKRTREEGTGLGLFITKSLVELHGGRISVRSDPEQETTFAVFLPLAHTANDKAVNNLHNER